MSYDRDLLRAILAKLEEIAKMIKELKDEYCNKDR